VFTRHLISFANFQFQLFLEKKISPFGGALAYLRRRRLLEKKKVFSSGGVVATGTDDKGKAGTVGGFRMTYITQHSCNLLCLIIANTGRNGFYGCKRQQYE
jgi:hypothetical protein